MTSASQIWFRNTAATIFSVTIGFLAMAPVWSFSWDGRPAAVFTATCGISILITAIFASFTVQTELHRRAIVNGVTVGAISLAASWMAQPLLYWSAPYCLVICLLISSVAVIVTLGRFPADDEHFLSSSRVVSALHLLQGIILFGIALPASIAWKWPRPFAAALMFSALALWRCWGACPLTLAENKLRLRENVAIIPPDQGFIKETLGKMGIPVLGTAVTTTLHAVAIALCAWWGVEWVVGMFN
jgi:hypothetical protein